MKLNRTSIGLAVRSARVAAAMTATDLSALTGISSSSISRTESGLRELEFSEALLISRALGISVSVLQDLAETFEREGAAKTADRIGELRHDLALLQREAIATAISLTSLSLGS